MASGEPFLLCLHVGHRSHIPYLGSVCAECRAKLEKPLLLNGLVEGPSVSEIAWKTEREVNQRISKLRIAASDVLNGEGV